MRDLLSEDRAAQLDIQNTKGSGTNVPEAIQIHVSSSQDVLDVMAQARRPATCLRAGASVEVRREPPP